jgi:hypothetical protein
VSSSAGRRSLVLVPEVEARAALGDRALSLVVLRPPYPALGCGVLRVLRVTEGAEGATEIVAGYESYERLDRPLRSAPRR